MKTAAPLPNLGDTYLVDPDGGSNKHLWMVVAVFKSELGLDCLWMVNATTNPKADKTCKLRVGDHPWFACDCHVWYHKARELEVDCLSAWVDRKQARLAPKVLHRVLEGAQKSKTASFGLKRAARASIDQLFPVPKPQAEKQGEGQE